MSRRGLNIRLFGIDGSLHADRMAGKAATEAALATGFGVDRPIGQE
ncbi:MAG: hypothetical protein HYS13_23770 [Planctomycetia bacterium]|nr:hypothetical protein [Planctomycetia bacterium]